MAMAQIATNKTFEVERFRNSVALLSNNEAPTREQGIPRVIEGIIELTGRNGLYIVSKFTGEIDRDTQLRVGQLAAFVFAATKPDLASTLALEANSWYARTNMEDPENVIEEVARIPQEQFDYVYTGFERSQNSTPNPGDATRAFFACYLSFVACAEMLQQDGF